MQNIPSKDLSERELEFLRRAASLQEALAVTLDYIQTELQPNPPANIARYRNLLEPKSESAVAFDEMSEFLAVVTSMARFLSNSAAMGIFLSRGVTGFADWVTLATVDAHPPGLTDRLLARSVGMNLKRTQRLIGRLADSGMILLSPGRKGGTSNIQITPLGQSRVREIEKELRPILKVSVLTNPSQFLHLASLVRRLSRIHDRAQHEQR